MLHHMLRAAAQRAFSVVDPYFKYVTMLLHGDGSALGSDTVTPFNSDASTNNFNITINGDARSNNFNPYQEGYYSNYFDGANTALNQNSSTNWKYLHNGSTWTIEFDIFPQTTSLVVLASTVKQLSNIGFTLQLNSVVANDVAFYFFNGSSYAQFSSTGNIVANQWNHVGITFDGSTKTCTFYINGVQRGSSSNTGFSYSASNSTYGLNIGCEASSYLYDFTGYLSNLRISTVVRSGMTTVPTTPYTNDANTSLLTCQSNRFIDNSSNAYTLDIVGTPKVAPAQPFTLPSSVATYGSGYFDGSGDYLSIADNSVFDFGSGNFTIETWANFSSASQEHIVVSQWPGASNRAWVIAVDASAGTILFAYTTNGTTQINVSVSFAFKASTWYHLAVCRDSTNLRIFVNGAVLTTYNISTSTIYNSSASILIGAFESGSIPLFGYVSNLRIVKGTAVYTTTFTPPTAPLTAITNTSLLTTQYNGAGNNNGFKDSSQNNFVITRNGNTTQGTFSPYGSNWSNYFDGTGDDLRISTNAAFAIGTGNFTFEAWINPPSWASAAPFFVCTGTGGLWIGKNGSNFVVRAYGVADQLQYATVPTTNVWTHIVAVRSGTTLSLFYNGTRVATTTNSYSFAQQPVSIGSDGEPVAPTYYTGYISNLRLVKGTAVYDPTASTLTVPTTPLTAITNTSLLTCQSNRFIDNSTNNFTITKNGDVSVQRFSPFSPTTAYSTSVIGGSGYFDGSGDYLSVAYNSAFAFSADFSVELFVYPISHNAYGGLIASATPTNPWNGWYLIFSNTSNQILVGLSNVDVYTSTASLTLNAWNHVVLCRSGSTVALFINGVRDGTVTNSGTFDSASYPVYVGVERQLSAFTNGYFSNVRIVKGSTPYSPSSTTITVPTAPLTAISGTTLLTNFTNAGVLDNAMVNDLETLGNAQVSTSVKKYGTGSIALDGTGDYLRGANSPLFAFGTGNFTVEMWVYFADSGATNRPLFDTGVTSNTGRFLIRQGDTASASNVVNAYVTGTTVSSPTISFNTWTHVAVVRNSGTVTIYINGTGGTGVSASGDLSQTGCLIGAFYDQLTWNFTGYIDDLRITKGVARYTANFTAPTAAFPNN